MESAIKEILPSQNFKQCWDRKSRDEVVENWIRDVEDESKANG